MRSLVRWGPFPTVAGLIFFLSHQTRLPVDLENTDWAAHLLAFGGLALTLVWGLSDRFRFRLSPGMLALVWVVCVLYGVIDEYHQSFVPGRVPSVGDIVADSSGALIAMALAGLILRARPARSAAR